MLVYHEYTHTILHLNSHWLPTWLDEGMAEFYSYTRFEQHKTISAPDGTGQIRCRVRRCRSKLIKTSEKEHRFIGERR